LDSSDNALYFFIGTGFYLRQKINYYFAYYFGKHFEHKNLTNPEKESLRIEKIIGLYSIRLLALIFPTIKRKEDIHGIA
jgi:lysozyme